MNSTHTQQNCIKLEQWNIRRLFPQDVCYRPSKQRWSSPASTVPGTSKYHQCHH